jgi:hypothetical protein
MNQNAETTKLPAAKSFGFLETLRNPKFLPSACLCASDYGNTFSSPTSII